MAAAEDSATPEQLERFFRVHGAQAGQRSAGLAAEFADYWRPHLEANRRFLLEGLSGVLKRERVLVLGAGACRDVPLVELAKAFDEVHLLDVDEHHLRFAVEQLRGEPDGEALAGKLHLHVADVTGGNLANLFLAGEELLTTETDPGRAFAGIIDLMAAYDETVPADLVQQLRSDCVISTGLASQLLPSVQGAFRHLLGQRFPGWHIPAEVQAPASQTMEEFRGKLIRQHVGTLAALTNAGGAVAWSDTVAESPFWGRIPPNQQLAVFQTLLNYLDSCSYPGIGELQLRKRSHLTPSLEGLLRLLSGQVRSNRLTAMECQELIAAIRGVVEQVCPTAHAEVIPGGLSACLGAGLTIMGPVRNWLWHLKPVELAALEVEAVWLRRG